MQRRLGVGRRCSRGEQLYICGLDERRLTFGVRETRALIHIIFQPQVVRQSPTWVATVGTRPFTMYMYPPPPKGTEPVFLNVYGAQESIPRNEFRRLAGRYDNPIPTWFPSLHKLFKNSISGRYITIQNTEATSPRCGSFIGCTIPSLFYLLLHPWCKSYIYVCSSCYTLTRTLTSTSPYAPLHA